MEYIFPDYYQEFHCTADRCEDNCCAGWEICIDEKTLSEYRRLSDVCLPFHRKQKASAEAEKTALSRAERQALARELKRKINWRRKSFRQDAKRRCAFQEEDGLCRLVKLLGEEGLCRTCHRYPRHEEVFENVRELSLSVSCPEVARMLMQREKPVRFIRRSTARTEEDADFDVLLYGMLKEVRETMFALLKDRKKPLALRAALVYALAHDVQKRIDDGRLFECSELCERIKEAAVEWHMQALLQDFFADEHVRCARARRWFSVLEGLERLRPQWTLLLLEARQRLYENAADYAAQDAAFEAWSAAKNPMWEGQQEQLLVYFINTYFCGAAYDGQAFGKVKLALISLFYIRELVKAVWMRNEQSFDLEDVVEVVYRYAREVEHSDENIACLERVRMLGNDCLSGD